MENEIMSIINNNNKRERIFDEEDADADEEKKMDKFYELMRKFRQERDRLRSQIFNDLQNNNNNNNNNNKNKKKIRSSCPSTGKQKPNQSSWAPSFKLEDFADNQEFQFVKPPLIFPSPTTTTTMMKRDDQQDDATLNLELAL